MYMKKNAGRQASFDSFKLAQGYSTSLIPVSVNSLALLCSFIFSDPAQQYFVPFISLDVVAGWRWCVEFWFRESADAPASLEFLWLVYLKRASSVQYRHVR
jgi:hypothetical protein